MTMEVLPLTDIGYQYFRDLLQEKVGLFFGEDRRRDLERHLTIMLKQTGISDAGKYYDQLHSAPSTSALWRKLILQLTVGETYFFRDSAQINALYSHVLPSLIKQRRKKNDLQLRLWSAGCATGEEPYSLAILLCDLIPDIQLWNISILGTDINQESLQRAEKAIYRDNSFRNETPDDLRERYFLPNGGASWELLPEIRKMVRFDYLNLAEAAY